MISLSEPLRRARPSLPTTGADIAAFVKRLTGAPVARVQFEIAVLRLLLSYLRGEAIVRLPTPDCVFHTNLDTHSTRIWTVIYSSVARGITVAPR